MRKAILCIFLLLVPASPVLAQYDIHLKNGAIIKGIVSYKEVNGQLKFGYAGGTVGMPMELVEKIEEARRYGMVSRRAAPPPPAAPMVAPPMAEKPDTGPIRQDIAEVDRKLAEIGRTEAEYEELKEEYDRIRLRIEVLFQKGIAAARRSGGDPAKWFQFLQGEDRQWAQLNTLRKNTLKKQLEELDEKMKPILEKKEELLEEKQRLEDELRQMQSPY